MPGGVPGVPGGAWGCPGPGGASWQQDGVLQGVRDAHLAPSPFPQSTQDFHEDLFPDTAGTLPATGAQAWWAGDSQQVSVIWGVSPSVVSPRAATAHCSARSQVGRVSLHPARRPSETFRSPVIARTQLQAPDIGPADTDTDRSVSMGHQAARQGCRGAGGSPLLSSSREGEGWDAGPPCPPAHSLS